MHRASVELITVIGAGVERYIADLAALRIAIFREYPYLYEGTLGYETDYLETYAASPDCVFVIARSEGRVVGVATGVPLIDEEHSFVEPLAAYGIAPASVFYYGESVLMPEFRSLGLELRFFDEREAYARRLGRFSRLAFCTVARAEDDPRRPADFRAQDRFWQRRGFRELPSLTTMYSWREIGEPVPTPKRMVFWLKELS